VSGSIAASAEGNKVAVRESLQNVAAGPLIKDLLERDLIEGRGDIALDVAAAGASVNAMKRSLSGTARVAFKDGAVKGINLAESFRKARAALGSKSAQQQRADQTQKTDFSELSASFKIRDGVAHNDDLTAKSPFLRLGGSGDIDIGNSTLNYTVRASVVTTARGQGGADLSHVAGLTVPVKLSGPFDAIKFDIDYGSGLRDKAKSKLEERLKDSLPGEGGTTPPADRVKERLRNLLRR
jgi:AsmA protein